MDNLVRIPINDAFCVDDLLASGFQAVTVLDVSQVAIEATKKGKEHLRRNTTNPSGLR
jgi:hypothetical protein